MAEVDLDKRFDIHVQAENKLAEIEKYECSIYCCHSTGCKSSGSDDILDLIKNIIAENQVEDKVRIVATGCMGLCAQGPLIRVEIKGHKDVLFKRLDVDAVSEIMKGYVLPSLGAKGDVKVPANLQKYVLSLDLPFFTKQEKVVLKNAGHMDPEDIYEYMARGGY